MPVRPPAHRASPLHVGIGLLLLVALPIATSGCAAGVPSPFGAAAGGRAGDDVPTLDDVPPWALASTARDDGRIVGIGSGADLEQATRHALRDLAGRLSVEVDARLRDVSREWDGRTAESVEQIIETRVSRTRFAGWERSRTARTRSGFWVEIRIDRDRLIGDSLLALRETVERVDRELLRARGSALRTLVALQTTAPDRRRADALVALLGTLDPGFDRVPWQARRADWEGTDEAARRALIFAVRSDPASREIAHWLESELAAEQLAIRPQGCLDPAAICIDVRSEMNEANVASRHVARIRSFFEVREPGGGVVLERAVVGRGDSAADPDRARREAFDDMRERLRDDGLLDVLLRR